MVRDWVSGGEIVCHFFRFNGGAPDDSQKAEARVECLDRNFQYASVGHPVCIRDVSLGLAWAVAQIFYTPVA